MAQQRSTQRLPMWVSAASLVLAMFILAAGALVGDFASTQINSSETPGARFFIGCLAASGFVVTAAFLALAAYTVHLLVAIYDLLRWYLSVSASRVTGPPRPAPGYGYTGPPGPPPGPIVRTPGP